MLINLQTVVDIMIIYNLLIVPSLIGFCLPNYSVLFNKSNKFEYFEENILILHLVIMRCD